MNLDRRLIKNFDWFLFSLVIFLSLIGIMTVFSATRSPISGEMPSFYIKQAYWLIISIIALIIVVSIDYVWVKRFAYILYGLGIILLMLVFLFGKTGMGAQRWLDIGVVSFQPSEVFKLLYLTAVSRYLSGVHNRIGLAFLIKIFLLIVFLPFILIVKQPDLGTALMILLLFLSVVAQKGLHRRVIVLIIVLGLVSIPFLGNIAWEGLRDYQKNRVIAFLDPTVDPSGIGYHINQSKVAVGSGNFFGKGYLKGTQGPLRFLPEKQTDFIFAVFAEEWGFAGSLIVLSIYLFIILRGLDTARKAKDEFGRLLAAGISMMFGLYFFINIGMTLGIMPVVGIPLPFMSYGGTALLTNFIAAGILINIRARRFELFY